MGLKLANAILAILAGVGSVLVLFWLLNWLVERIPGRLSEKLKPWVFVGPAIALISVFLIYPAVRTIILSFFDNSGSKFVGLDNYTQLATDTNFHQTLLNTLLWIIIVPVSAVVLGLLVAILADRLASRGEKLTKSMIFMPMAISMVGASTIWGMVYDWNPPGTDQIGLLNSALVALGANHRSGCRSRPRSSTASCSWSSSSGSRSGTRWSCCRPQSRGFLRTRSRQRASTGPRRSRHSSGSSSRSSGGCLLYTSDAADDLLCVDLGGRRIIKKKKKKNQKKN